MARNIIDRIAAARTDRRVVASMIQLGRTDLLAESGLLGRGDEHLQSRFPEAVHTNSNESRRCGWAIRFLPCLATSG